MDGDTEVDGFGRIIPIRRVRRSPDDTRDRGVRQRAENESETKVGVGNARINSEGYRDRPFNDRAVMDRNIGGGGFDRRGSYPSNQQGRGSYRGGGNAAYPGGRERRDNRDWDGPREGPPRISRFNPPHNNHFHEFPRNDHRDSGGFERDRDGPRDRRGDDRRRTIGGDRDRERDREERPGDRDLGEDRANDSRSSRCPGPMPPMMTFKKFMDQQEDDLEIEEFRKRYENYQTEYALDCVRHFFESHKDEEWFQDKYNPHKQKELDSEAAQWAVSESAWFKSTADSNRASELVEACRLDQKLPHPSRQSSTASSNSNQVNVSSPDEPLIVIEDSQIDGNPVAVPSSSGSAEDKEKSIPVAGKHLSGHTSRTVYISGGIPAACSRSAFKAAIAKRVVEMNASYYKNTNNALVPGSVLKYAVERTVLSQPTQSARSQGRLERFAWVVMTTNEGTSELVRSLRESELEILYPSRGDATERVQFSVLIPAVNHQPRLIDPLKEFNSTAARVVFDTERTAQLAAALDDDRDIPADQQLSALLDPAQYPKLASAMTLPTDRLDFSVAYLRRTHFMLYFHARRCVDEAHLLLTAPGVQNRSVPYIPDASGNPFPAPSSNTPAETTSHAFTSSAVKAESSSVIGTDAELDITGTAKELENGSENTLAVVAESSSSGAAGGGEDDGEEDGADSALARQISGAGGSKTGSNRQGGRGYPVTWVDRRITEYIRELHAKTARRRQLTDPNRPPEIKLTVDEEDCEAISAEYEKITTAWVEKYMKIEPEGKARCCFSGCQKLFRSADFLRKHMLLRHTHMLDELKCAVADPFMRRRYESEDIGLKYLPSLEMWVSAGGGPAVIEKRSVLDFLRPPQPPKPTGPPPPQPPLLVASGMVMQGLGGVPPPVHMGLGMPYFGMNMGPEMMAGDGSLFPHPPPVMGAMNFWNGDRVVGGKGGGRFFDGGGGRGGRFSGRGGRGVRGRNDEWSDRGQIHSYGRDRDASQPSFKREREEDSGAVRDSSGGSEDRPIGSEEAETRESIFPSVSASKISRMDIDAPKGGEVQIDYGMTVLPPPKKLKIFGKKKATEVIPPVVGDN